MRTTIKILILFCIRMLGKYKKIYICQVKILNRFLEHYDNNEEVAMSDFNGLVSCVNMVYQNHVKEQVYMQNIYI